MVARRVRRDTPGAGGSPARRAARRPAAGGLHARASDRDAARLARIVGSLYETVPEPAHRDEAVREIGGLFGASGAAPVTRRRRLAQPGAARRPRPADAPPPLRDDLHRAGRRARGSLGVR